MIVFPYRKIVLHRDRHSGHVHTDNKDDQRHQPGCRRHQHDAAPSAPAHPLVFGAMVMAFTVDVRSAFVFVVTIPVLCVVVFGIMAVGMPLYKSVRGNSWTRCFNHQGKPAGGVSSAAL